MTQIDAVLTGKNISLLMQEQGLTVKDVQEQLCFECPQPIYRWKKGQNVPTIHNLVVLSEVFGVSIDEIVVRRTS